VPLAQDSRSLVDVVDRVDADDRVERLVLEGEPLARVGPLEMRSLGEPRSRAASFPAATPVACMSTPVTRQPVFAAVNSAVPPDPLATSSNSLEGPSSSHSQKARSSSAVSHEFWPMSSPHVSRRIDAYNPSAKRP